ncbi:ATP-dependent RNA helicase [Nesidiocoris tenuis]|uniref:ATP-dependent RNA helicase n=1 Tax=Nesidiocoris tenuis TaxID=355587 RepID=A0ABN7AP43_9HEMI|nr:ATP-dependent RNA helicase [Nesidiocoris tenuis]
MEEDQILARRYTGEEDGESVRNQSSNNLKKLLRTIEKRKKSQTTNATKPSDVDSGIECTLDSKTSVLDKHVPQVIGGHAFDKGKKVVAVLPKWLAEPVVISTDLSCLTVKAKKFTVLDELLRKNLKANGVKYLFPVQAEVIPWLVRRNCSGKLHKPGCTAPRDLCVSAPTGSGKTLTYVLPIVNSLKDRLVPKLRALIVVPVQELALQVVDVFRKYIQGTKLRVEASTGGKTDLKAEQWKLVRRVGGLGEAYESKIDILVTTPGRLVEHLTHTKGFDVSNLKYLILDEADRIMENVQDDWMHVLEKSINRSDKNRGRTASIASVRTLRNRRQPQKLLFSATLSHDPEKLKELGLFQPILFTSVVGSESDPLGEIRSISTDDYAGKYTTPRELKEFYVAAPARLKPLVLWALLVNRDWRKILVFAKSVEDSHRLARLLNSLPLSGRVVSELSSKLSRAEREDTLRRFSDGTVNVLVASDVLARGMDVPGVEAVVSYDPPKHVEGYVHRAGRTGRAGAEGVAVTLLDPDGQMETFLHKLRSVNKTNLEEMTVAEEEYSDMVGEYKAALASLNNAIAEETDAKKLDLKRKKQNCIKTNVKSKKFKRNFPNNNT